MDGRHSSAQTQTWQLVTGDKIKKVMSLLTGSACAPLIPPTTPPVLPRHRRAHLRSPLPLSASLSLLNWQAGRQKDRRRAEF